MDIISTTSLKKISALKGKYRVAQGSMGSSKTFSILMILINHCLLTPNVSIIIATKELTKLRMTCIKDFVSIMNFFNVFKRDNFKAGVNYTFDNGSVMRFIGLDREDLGKGLRSDVVFINEANKISYEAFRELTSRTKVVYLDYNPNSLFWVHSNVIDRKDASFVKLTYKDNEACPQGEINEILSYKERGYDKNGNVINEYFANRYQVYGLGEIGSVEGKIYNNWKEISYADFESIDARTIIGLDFGLVDPFALIECKYVDGNLYINELNYESENEIRKRFNARELKIIGEDGLVTWLFRKLNISQDLDVICDNNRRRRLLSLRDAGWERAVATKKFAGSIMDGIGIVQSINVYYTSTSENIKMEYLNYCWKQDRNGVTFEEPTDLYNHLHDCIRYVCMYLRDLGIIRKV